MSMDYKAAFKGEGKYIWFAIRNIKTGLYHCPIDNSIISESLTLAGNLHTKEFFRRDCEYVKQTVADFNAGKL